MSLRSLEAEGYREINLTATSTLWHLLSAAIACIGLWIIIAITISL